jgi:hemolysin activation/secretion protein
MKLVGVISTAVLTLSLGAAVPAYAQQDQHDQQEEKEKPAEKKSQPEKPARVPEKSAQEEKNARQQEVKPEAKSEARPEAKSGEPAQRAGGNRIPDDKYRANFGQAHRFRVSQGDYRNHRFQYGGYSFGFVGVWPSNWLYTQDVYVIEIDGVYYLCNPMYPGVNIALSFTL